MTTALYLSLGHNASAVISHFGSIVAGYEQERLDRVKSSSAYPKDAIEACVSTVRERVDVAYVSHWFDDLGLKSNKYLDLDHLRGVAEHIVGLTPSFTHHDAHAQSAVQFYRNASGRQFETCDIVVMDGFGTWQECFSVYQSRNVLTDKPILTHRTYGYANSLGLMYQYATAWLGMKENQDEYKLLGYESHVLEHIPERTAYDAARRVTDQAMEHAETMLSPHSQEPPPRTGELIAYGALRAAKALWTERFDRWRRMFPVDLPEEGVRACIAFCVQKFIEECTVALVEQLVPIPMGKHVPVLILTGGCFLNVKLNRRIMTETNRRIFPHPLAGDQGAAMGHTPGLHFHSGPPALGWGRRRILGRHGQVPLGVEIVGQEEWVGRARELLQANRIVNVVRDGMEFGPRALCNTSTLALPTKENVRIINALNERDESMPMAPVMTQSAADALFGNSENEHTLYARSFMITTCAFKAKPVDALMGVAHKHPIDDQWTARPQVVSDYGPVGRLLVNMEHEVLINTSFNYHGEPIVYSEDDACRTHSMQCFRAQQLGIDPPVTLLVRS